MAPWVDALRLRGITARAIDLPRRRAEDAVPAFEEQIADGTVVLGGHSFGGRVASLVAAARLDRGEPVTGLVLLSYPLHRPGHPESWQARAAHWPRLTCPVLLLSGEADPFARIDLLRAALPTLPDARLLTFPRLGHGLLRVVDAAADRIAAFVRDVAP